jgi:hypothetical protein
MALAGVESMQASESVGRRAVLRAKLHSDHLNDLLGLQLWNDNTRNSSQLPDSLVLYMSYKTMELRHVIVAWVSQIT